MSVRAHLANWRCFLLPFLLVSRLSWFSEGGGRRFIEEAFLQLREAFTTCATWWVDAG